MYSAIYSGALCGVSAYLVSVEVDIARGLPGFSMVGSLGSEVRESRERVMVALKNVGIELPPCHITVNLSPADMRKEGTAFDLPIAVGVLEAMGVLPSGAAAGMLFLGELGLDGELKKARGVLPIVRAAGAGGVRQCIVPGANAKEGAVIPDAAVRGADNICEVIAFLKAGGGEAADALLPAEKVDVGELFQRKDGVDSPDFRDVNGQTEARRAAEIAAAGFHNLLMTGPPGAGKSMIAGRIPGILPDLTLEESLEVTAVVSVAGLMKEGDALVTQRPFKSPHHTVSQAALLGGSAYPRPGIISLAHRGVLFLDELPEFSRNALEILRQPMEEGQVTISRASGTFVFPAHFQLVSAMNPCRCGYYPDRERCHCLPGEISQYLRRISRPLLDRIDICAEISRVEYRDLTGTHENESSAGIRYRVETAQKIQKERYQELGWQFNSQLPVSAIRHFCILGQEETRTMELAFEKLGLSARAYHRILKVARTIADLAGEKRIRTEHLLEAIGYRSLDQKFWGR